jgi:hypothetical protein
MRCLALLVAVLVTLAAGFQDVKVPDELAKLPLVVQRDISAWRVRLASAKCLKVVLDTSETWTSLHELGADGSPTLLRSERFCFHSWMTPDSVWVVGFGYQEGKLDTSQPVFQQYWSSGAAKIWERVWSPTAGCYTVRRYDCKDPFGEGSPDFPSAQGCIYSSVTSSWVAGPVDLANRSASVRSVAFLRRPNLAIVPPDCSQTGIWLDVFKEEVQRDEDRAPESLYRRRDLMLLARGRDGAPALREWRTIVTSDPTHSGQMPQQITGIRRFSFDFYEAPPPELAGATHTFVTEVDRAIGR